MAILFLYSVWFVNASMLPAIDVPLATVRRPVTAIDSLNGQLWRDSNGMRRCALQMFARKSSSFPRFAIHRCERSANKLFDLFHIFSMAGSVLFAPTATAPRLCRETNSAEATVKRQMKSINSKFSTSAARQLAPCIFMLSICRERGAIVARAGAGVAGRCCCCQSLSVSLDN